MAGVRLHHPSLFDCMYVVELGTPFANEQPKFCPTCLKSHARKSLHLKLDSNGDVFVTPGVLETLRTVFLAGLEVVNEVEKPPPLSIGAVDQDKIYVLDHPLNKSLTAAPSYRKARTKYESEARMRKTLERLLRRNNG